MSNALSDLVRAERAKVTADADALVAAAEAANRDLTTEEWEIVTRAAEAARPLDARIASVESLPTPAPAAQRALGGIPNVSVRSEPLTYQRGDRRQSYFRDLGLAHVGGDESARQRLARHRAEVDVELPKMEARHEARARREIEELGGTVESRDITRVDGAGGEFVPPLWIMEEYAEYARAGRVTAGLVRQIGLPAGTDSISLPRITGGTAAGVQTADNGAVSETDMTTGSVTGPVRTIAGQQDIALQLLEQSPLMFDEIVFGDLTADYNSKLTVQILNGTGSSGQHTGFLALSGTNSVSYTDASPTVPEFFPTGAQAASQAATGRKLPMSAFVMHSRRWYWMMGALDSSNRPYVVPGTQGPQNALATLNGTIAEGPVGTWHGLPVYLDQNMPTTLGGGTEDAILVFRGADHILFEGALRTRALPEVLSGNLTVRLQVYAYSAFICGRFPAGVSKITGTGLAAPSGY